MKNLHKIAFGLMLFLASTAAFASTDMSWIQGGIIRSLINLCVVFSIIFAVWSGIITRNIYGTIAGGSFALFFLIAPMVSVSLSSAAI